MPFASSVGHTYRVLVRLLVERYLGDRCAIGLQQRADVIVKTLHTNLSLRRAHRAEDADQRIDGIRHGRPMQARVQIACSAANVNLDTAGAFQTDEQLRLILGPLAPVGAEDEVAGETLTVGCDEHRQLRACDLLFALQQELHVHRQRAPCPQHGLDAEDTDQQVGLHVTGAASVDAATANLRRERGRRPQLQRVNRLDIKVTVDQHGSSARGMQPIPVDHRVAGRGKKLNVLQPRAPKTLGCPPGRSPDVVLMLWNGRTAGDPQEVDQLIDRRGSTR
jgi:hypothetical protein